MNNNTRQSHNTSFLLSSRDKYKTAKLVLTVPTTKNTKTQRTLIERLFAVGGTVLCYLVGALLLVRTPTAVVSLDSAAVAVGVLGRAAPGDVRLEAALSTLLVL